MDTIITILTAVISAITLLGSIWLKDYLARRKEKLNEISTEDKSMFYLEMDKMCGIIRESLLADGSYLAYFHNGGTFGNGISMDKFTVVGEDYNDKFCKLSYKKLYCSTMINYIPYVYHRLLINNRFIATSTNDVSDISFKNDLVRRKVSSIYMFLIKDVVTDKPIGFFALEYMDSTNIPRFDESLIWKHQNRLCKLLNMTVLSDMAV